MNGNINERKNIFKISNYDNFKCTADKCRFTCCDGWDVNIDIDTYDKWKKENDKLDNILSNVKTKKCKRKTEYLIKKETDESCPFLDKQGLCHIVKSYGEDYLAFTCNMFPRMENVFKDRAEYTLSCACPEVVNLISCINERVHIISEDNTNLRDSPLELEIRRTIVDIIQQDDFLLEDKLIISFHMLANILKDENLREDNILEELDKYKKEEYIKELIHAYREIELNINDSVEEINYLFLDIIHDYKEVSILNGLLKDVSNFAEEIKLESLCEKWNDYKNLFEQYNMLIENCFVSKILSSCISNDIEEMVISFQLIILEYLLVRYAVFLKYCMNKNRGISTIDIKDYIVAFSRIIGNNAEAVREFFKEGFGDEILEVGYLCFIMLF